MPVIVQAMTLAGKIIETARWEVSFPAGILVGHSIALNVPTNDSALIGYLSRSQTIDCMVDKTKEGHSIALNCQVKAIRHMVETKVSKADTMALVIPNNRLVEYVLMYLYTPSKVSPQFMRAMRNGETPNQNP